MEKHSYVEIGIVLLMSQACYEQYGTFASNFVVCFVRKRVHPYIYIYIYINFYQ